MATKVPDLRVVKSFIVEFTPNQQLSPTVQFPHNTTWEVKNT